MAFYNGAMRQRGGSLPSGYINALERHGLGGVYRMLTRHLVPAIKRVVKPYLKKQAKKAIPNIAKAGIGLVSDLQNKKLSFKQAVKARGKRLASDVFKDVLNNNLPPPKRHKASRSRAGNTSLRGRKKNRPTRDIFS